MYQRRKKRGFLFPETPSFFYFHKSFSSHREQTPGAPNRTAETADARLSDKATPVSPESRFKAKSSSRPQWCWSKSSEPDGPFSQTKKASIFPNRIQSRSAFSSLRYSDGELLIPQTGLLFLCLPQQKTIASRKCIGLIDIALYQIFVGGHVEVGIDPLDLCA